MVFVCLYSIEDLFSRFAHTNIKKVLTLQAEGRRYVQEDLIQRDLFSSFLPQVSTKVKITSDPRGALCIKMPLGFHHRATKNEDLTGQLDSSDFLHPGLT